MTTDELQAESRKYLDTRIILVPLDSGNFAIYNNAAELCTIVGPQVTGLGILNWWRERSPVRKDRSHVTLEELGL